MPFPRFARVFILPIASFSLLAAAQTTTAAQPSDLDNAFVQKAFGPSCTLNPAVPSLAADLNGDGVEDIVIAARCTEPMVDAAENHYQVIDPYNSFYGFGDPKITTQFATNDPKIRSLALLIIHGAGPEAWRSASPQAKFLIVNLPYKHMSVKRYLVKKRTTMAVYVEELGGNQTSSAVYWDGKKYKYQPIGSNME